MRALLLPLVGLLLSVATPAHAYNFIYDAGCGPNQGAAWRRTSNWYLNDRGYSRIPRTDVEAVLSRSMDTWADPCCSAWSHSYAGSTSDGARSVSSRNVVEFAESTWPGELGSVNSVIAVTLPVGSSNCSITSADMLFNAVGFTFRIDGSTVDLQSIATHEFGHWLGLDHSSESGSTMLPYYSNGIDERDLTPDDVEGVCALYPGACGCTFDADCQPGQACVAGSCTTATCTVNDDCPAHSICWEGSCIPGCRDGSECGDGEICDGGECVRDPALCSICSPCTSSADCGGDGYYCVNTGAGGVCTKSCSGGGSCDGDSVCRTVGDGSGNSYQLCFAPGDGALCPSSYSCDGAVAVPGCSGLWTACTDLSGCSVDDDRCLPYGDGSHCTCSCTADSDCGEGATCLVLDDGTKACVPDSAIDPCNGVRCPSGTVCEDGTCVDPCDGVSCGTGERCEAGSCVSVCGACEPGTHCDPESGSCAPDDPCAGVTCGTGETCEGGSCVPVDPCAGVVCAEGERCVGGGCTTDPCAGVTCESGQACSNGRCETRRHGGSSGGGCSSDGSAPALVSSFLALAFALGRRRRFQ